MEANELIERYAYEVGQHLPRKGRDDIRLELQSHLLDNLDERAGAEKATVEMAADLLHEYGKPEKMAARYLPERYLIGPQLFPLYRLVLIIVLAVIAGSMGLSLAFTFIGQGVENVNSWLWNTLLGFLQGSMSAVGSITIVFAIIERVSAGRVQLATEYEDEAWNPLDLTPIEDRDRINRPELVVAILFYIGLIVLFNFFPHWIGIYRVGGESQTVIPILSPEFAVFIPWLTVLWAAEIVHRLLLLRDGRWHVYTRWLEVGVKGFDLFIIYSIATGGAITNFAWLDLFIRFGLWIGFVVGIIEVVVKIFRLLTGRATGRNKSIIGRLA
jgi:hypothetical protein